MRTQLSPEERTDHQPRPWGLDRDQLTKDLLRRAARAEGPERQRLIDEVVLIHLRLAESVARRYDRRGIDRDDLVQVANLGLVLAAQRFDPELGKDFVSFAMPTITGEVKRYFRDRGWMVRPPRRVQELHASVAVATAELTQTLGAAPSAADLAEHLGVDADDVLEATASSECFTVASIDYRGTGGEESALADSLGEAEPGFARAEAVIALAPACRALRPRDRHILYLRFFRGCTQQEIAEDLGVTQMQVSRLLSRILRHLRTALGVDEPEKPVRRRAPRGHTGS